MTMEQENTDGPTGRKGNKMERIIMSGRVKKWDYDWRVMELSDTNGSLPVYAVERNQGAHDERYFFVKLTIDKDEAIRTANRLFAGR